MRKGGGTVSNEKVEKEAEGDRQATDRRWRRAAGTKLTWRLFLLPLAGGAGTACGNNHPPNAS